jgi:hypothetical protein
MAPGFAETGHFEASGVNVALISAVPDREQGLQSMIL